MQYIILSSSMLLLFQLAHSRPKLDTTQQALSALQSGYKWYVQRAKGAKGLQAQAGPLDSAIHYYNIALREKKNELEAAIGLLKCFHFRANFYAKSNEEKKAIYQKGKNLGEKLVKKYADSAPLHFWMAVIWGKWAEAYGKLKAAREGAAGKIRSYCEAAIRLDPTYLEGGSYRVLGRLHHQSPRIPLILGWPSNKEAVKFLRKAVETGPDNLQNRLFLSEVLFDEGQKQEAANILRIIIKAEPRSWCLLEDRQAVHRAGILLNKMEK